MASSSTLDKKIFSKTETSVKRGQRAAFLVGENLAQKALKKKIEKIVFDRGDHPYHGRVKSIAEGARKQGLIF